MQKYPRFGTAAGQMPSESHGFAGHRSKGTIGSGDYNPLQCTSITATTKNRFDFLGIDNMAVSASYKTFKPLARWFRFRITTLLLLIGMFAFWLAVQANRAKDERRGAAAVHDAGGSVRFDYQFSDDDKFQTPFQHRNRVLRTATAGRVNTQAGLVPNKDR